MSNQTAIFAAGCFWCIEAVYNRLKGVHNATSGYINGHTPAPTYAEVCSGHSGHAEAVKIEFDPEIISYRTLLEVLFTLHDPTQLNRQGADVGTQYRSAIFFANEAQRLIAERYIAQIEAAGVFDAPIATTLEPLERFYAAEAYHHDYAARNPWQPYIRAVAAPKVEKLRKTHGDLLKDRT